jgi:hypothetical protein
MLLSKDNHSIHWTNSAARPSSGHQEETMARRNSGDYAVVWPRSAKAVDIKPLAKRLDMIEG